MSLGQRIRQRREALKLTQEQLAKNLGLTSQYISIIEQDKRSPSLSTLAKLAEELGVEGEDGNCQILQEPIKNGAFITRLRKKDCVVFTTGCVEALFEALDTVIEQHQRKISLLDTNENCYQTRKTRLQTKLQHLKGYREDYEIFEISKKEWQLDKKKQITLKDKILCMYLNDTFDGPYASRPPICLNIKYGSTLQNANDSPSEVSPTTETGNEVTNG